MRFLTFCLIFVCHATLAGELNGVTLPDSVKVGDRDMQLNGMGLRTVVRYGLRIKVYVGGLYLEEKSSEPSKILSSDNLKLMKIVFKRAVDKEKLQEGFKEGIEANCIDDSKGQGRGTCKESKEKLKEFNKLIVDVNKGHKINITFYPDKVEVDSEGRQKKNGIVESAKFSRDLLSVFIGKYPPTKIFKKGVLGLLDSAK